MSHSALLKVAAAVSAFFGLVLLLAPNLLLTLYQAPLMNSPGIYNSMLYGGALLGFAAMNWSGAGAVAESARPLLLGNLVADAIGAAVTFYLQVTDPVVPRAAWGNVVILVVFTVLFAQALLRLRRAAGGVVGSAPAA